MNTWKQKYKFLKKGTVSKKSTAAVIWNMESISFVPMHHRFKSITQEHNCEQNDPKRCQPHTHTRLTTLCPGLPGWAGTRKVKPIWLLLKQETVSGSGISWAICKSAPRSRQIPRQHSTAQFFTGRMPFLPPNQRCQSTEGTTTLC